VLYQLRRYRVRDGAMDEFLALFHDHIVPARKVMDFEVLGPWVDREDGTFVWIVGHEAPGGWEAIDRAYYESPGRSSVPRDPKELLEDVQLKVLAPA